ncbi:MAG: tetratricopeptide repeat protein [Planctomycetaceae bacterium]|nr:tetratricopeptide repeat protein [Planctomycetaceae bacterium]
MSSATPDPVQAAIQAALDLHRSGQPAAAEQILRQVVAQFPDHAVAWNLLGAMLHEQGQTLAAAECLARAVALRPDVPSFHGNLAEVLRVARRLDEALVHARQAWQMVPDHAEYHHKLGLVLADLHHGDEAIACYQKTVQLNPQHADAYLNWGCELVRQQRAAEAVPLFLESIRLNEDSPLVYNNLGAALSLIERPTEAIHHFRVALQQQPDFSAAYTNLLFASNYDAAITPDELFAWHVDFGRRIAPPPDVTLPWPHDRSPMRRLRIAYITSDTRRHPVAFFLLPLLRAHDRMQVEVMVYSDSAVADDVSDLLVAASDRWVSTLGVSDAAFVERLRADRIDVAIDLAGHTTGNRLLALARRVAPVQVSYLGYVNTTGLKQIDCRLTDAICDPPDEPSRYTEQLFRLPRHFSAYAPYPDAPAVTPLPALARGHVTFGSLHSLAKLGPATIALWSSVLQAVPGSRLVIVRKTLTPELQQRLMLAFAEHGIVPERLDFVGDWMGPNHLGCYADIDITLDVVPWSGHTTACEAIWMGVPIITLYGNRTAGRMVSSVLTALGMPECIARSPTEFVAIARRLSSNLAELAALREQLRGRLQRSPLGDGASLARAVEDAYRSMWQRWCARSES